MVHADYYRVGGRPYNVKTCGNPKEEQFVRSQAPTTAKVSSKLTIRFEKSKFVRIQLCRLGFKIWFETMRLRRSKKNSNPKAESESDTRT